MNKGNIKKIVKTIIGSMAVICVILFIGYSLGSSDKEQNAPQTIETLQYELQMKSCNSVKEMLIGDVTQYEKHVYLRFAEIYYKCGVGFTLEMEEITDIMFWSYPIE